MDPEYELWKKVTTVFMNKCHFLSFNFAVIVMFLLLPKSCKLCLKYHIISVAGGGGCSTPLPPSQPNSYTNACRAPNMFKLKDTQLRMLISLSLSPPPPKNWADLHCYGCKFKLNDCLITDQQGEAGRKSTGHDNLPVSQ